MSRTSSAGYEKPTVERYGSFRELTRIGGCVSGHSFLTFGCKGSPTQDLGGGDGGGGGGGGGGRS